jgi:hypothetical protein
MKIWAEDLPIDRYATKPVPGKRLHQVFEGANRRGIIWESEKLTKSTAMDAGFV